MGHDPLVGEFHCFWFFQKKKIGFLLVLPGSDFFFGFLGLPIPSFLKFFKSNLFRFELFRV
jgi:hypothetical protein